MKMKDIYSCLCYQCIQEINESYSIERLNKELKMDSMIDKHLIDDIIKSNINFIVRGLSDEAGKALYKICEKQKVNSQNTMLAVKYEDNDMYARSFVEYLVCCETVKQIEECLGEDLIQGWDL